MKIKVLVVDDDPDEKVIYNGALKLIADERVEIMFAESAMQAFDMLYYFNPDFLLVDHSMPIVNGLQMLEILHLQKRFPLTKKYVFSSSVSPRCIEQARSVGAIACIEKAGTMTELSDTLKTILFEKTT